MHAHADPTSGMVFAAAAHVLEDVDGLPFREPGREQLDEPLVLRRREQAAPARGAGGRIVWGVAAASDQPH